jgi:uncharacterized protein (TIGR02646 family)
MRKIDNYFEDIPESVKPEELLKKGIIQRVMISRRVRSGDYNRDGVKEKLVDKYAHKCAYCEKTVTKYDDIEHFRPKAEVTEDIPHGGYYWLGFIWSNFLVACNECNRTGAKGNKFPVTGTRITVPYIDFANPKSIADFFKICHIEALESEERLLLHPVLDNPDDHLEFEANGGVKPKNGSSMGRNSIEVYGLNDFNNRQEDLFKPRKAIVEQVEGEVEHSILHFQDDKRLYQDILKINVKLLREIQNKEPFSAVRRTCLSHFKPFFIDRNINFSENQKKILMEICDKIQKDLRALI